MVLSLIVEDMDARARRAPLSKEQKEKLEAFALDLQKKLGSRHFKDKAEIQKILTDHYQSEEEAKSVLSRRARVNEDGSVDLLFRPDVGVLYGSLGNTEEHGTTIADIKIPILFMQSDPQMGSAISPKGIEHIKSNKPDANIYFFDGAGHVIHRAQEERFIKVLETFIKDGKIDNTSFRKP